jgi:galactose mutarotase-like enzyme
MNALGNSCEMRREQGFAVYLLASQEVELAVVPELGARIISLQDVRTGREWLWHPAGGLKLFRNQPGDHFEASPLVGVDECFPTIAPCQHQGRALPDHGELWTAAWAVDQEAWGGGLLRTSVRAGISPFDFSRTIELVENEVRLQYQLTNRSTKKEEFLWALHPLLRLQAGDHLELPLSTRALLNGEPWLDNISRSGVAGECAKVFAAPVTEGCAVIRNRTTGDYLEFEWSPAENNVLGVWLTRGGWHGHEHFALEPTNSDTDTLSLAAARGRCGMLEAGQTTQWRVSLRVGA